MKRRFSSDFWTQQRGKVRGHAAHTPSPIGLRTVDCSDYRPVSPVDAATSLATELTDWAGRPMCLSIPEHYEAKYPYPLIVWLHGRGGNERELLTAMPMISQRNYLGASFRGPRAAVEQRPGGFRWSLDEDDLLEFEAGLYDEVCGLRREYHIHSERVFLAGFDEGATLAFDLFLRQPQRYGGVVSLAGNYPQTGRSLARFRDLRNERVLISTGASDTVSTPADNVRAGRLLHAAGMSVSTRIVDGGHEVTRPMLRQIDHWIMDGICS